MFNFKSGNTRARSSKPSVLLLEAFDQTHMVLTCALDGTVESANAQFCKISGFDAATVEGKDGYLDAYSHLVGRIGSQTSAAQINRDSSETLLNTSQQSVDNTSGVNLDEEAAALIEHELAYNASAQVIQVARSIFDTLIATFN